MGLEEQFTSDLDHLLSMRNTLPNELSTNSVDLPNDEEIEKMANEYFTKVGSVDNRKDIRFDYMQGLSDMAKWLRDKAEHKFPH